MKCPPLICKAIYVGMMILGFACLKDRQSCDNCPDDIEYRYTFDGAEKYFRSGLYSFWVYMNTNTGALDTQVCLFSGQDTYTTQGDFDYSRHIKIKYDYYSRKLESSLKGTSYTDFIAKPSADDKASLNTPQRTILRKSNNYMTGQINVFFFPFETNTSITDGRTITTCTGIDSVMTLHGKQYFNVARFQVDGDISDNYNSGCQITGRRGAIYYWAKGVGLIKREILACNYSWELIDYYVR